jgi:hypothetical protein
MAHTPTILCLASYFKGADFLQQCKAQGCTVLLILKERIRNEEWPPGIVDEFVTIADDATPDLWLHTVSQVARRRRLDRLVTLEEYDVMTAALVREHLRIPGMGTSTARLFRDKLAMRVKADEAGVRVPDFVHVLNEDELRGFMRSVPAPWVLKPRAQAAALGIRRLTSAAELWSTLEVLGDGRADYLLEQFIPGDVFHVDSIVFNLEVRFACASRYETPPLVVAHDAGIFVTRTLAPGDPDAVALTALNARVLKSFGLQRGVSHTEFIRAHDGSWNFLETSARVGGAFIVDVVDVATGINLWREWARLEIAGEDGTYEPPPRHDRCGGIVLSLARQESPDMSAYTDPEIVVRVRKSHHAGLIVASPDSERVVTLLRGYTERFYTDFHASAPPPERPTD